MNCLVREADEDGSEGDDAADCLRYLVATKARRVEQRKLRGCEAPCRRRFEC